MKNEIFDNMLSRYELATEQHLCIDCGLIP